METDDYLQPEVGIAVVVAAALCAPSVRRALRRGATYGLAGLMVVGDALAALTRDAGRGLRVAGAAGSPQL